MTTPKVDVTLLGESLATVSAIVPTDQWPVWLQIWLTQLDPAHSPLNAYEMSLQFTTDATIAQLNRDYRQQDQATDVLSFAALEDAPLPPEVLATIPVNLGDLIVSVETAQRQCEAHGHSLTEELAWLVAHGLLHLLGWDHPTEARLQAMWTLQRSLLAQVGLSLPATAYTIGN
ncbi:MAG: rRNA maturation RNase YbeY [Cyanobacteria bacterium P01_E01_bin.43]